MGLLDEIRGYVKEQQSIIKNYQKDIQSLKEGISSQEGELFDRGDYLTIFNKVNQDLLADILRTDKRNLSALDSEKGGPELLNLYDEIKRTCQANNSLMSTTRLGLEQNPIENEGTKCVVDRAALIISSPSLKLRDIIGEKNRDIKELISEKAHLNYVEQAHVKANDLTDPWDIGVTYFVGTSFLDNIRCFRDSFTLYQAQAEKLFLHHTALMEKGEYIVRSKVLNLTDKAGALANREKSSTSFEDEKALKEEILSLYKKYNLIEILKKYR